MDKGAQGGCMVAQIQRTKTMLRELITGVENAKMNKTPRAPGVCLASIAGQADE
jgi:hypothetical protein